RRLDAVDDQRVAGVVAALEAHDALRALRQPVDQLALAFVAPLGSDDDHVSSGGYAHDFSLFRIQMACTRHSPSRSTSSRSQWNSSISLSCPGRTPTTVFACLCRP